MFLSFVVKARLPTRVLALHSLWDWGRLLPEESLLCTSLVLAQQQVPMTSSSRCENSICFTLQCKRRPFSNTLVSVREISTEQVLKPGFQCEHMTFKGAMKKTRDLPANRIVHYGNWSRAFLHNNYSVSVKFRQRVNAINVTQGGNLGTLAGHNECNNSVTDEDWRGTVLTFNDI